MDVCWQATRISFMVLCLDRFCWKMVGSLGVNRIGRGPIGSAGQEDEAVTGTVAGKKMTS